MCGGCLKRDTWSVGAIAETKDHSVFLFYVPPSVSLIQFGTSKRFTHGPILRGWSLIRDSHPNWFPCLAWHQVKVTSQITTLQFSSFILYQLLWFFFKDCQILFAVSFVLKLCAPRCTRKTGRGRTAVSDGKMIWEIIWPILTRIFALKFRGSSKCSSGNTHESFSCYFAWRLHNADQEYKIILLLLQEPGRIHSDWCDGDWS